MLLRGVKFTAPALNEDDIQATRGRAATSGRHPGGQPQRGQYGGRGRGSYNYGSQSKTYTRQQTTTISQQSYGAQNSYSQYGAPPQGWQPPPPGIGGFARGPPPPPPGMYNQSSQPPPPFSGQYGSQYPAAPAYPQHDGNRASGSYGNAGSGPPQGYYRY